MKVHEILCIVGLVLAPLAFLVVLKIFIIKNRVWKKYHDKENVYVHQAKFFEKLLLDNYTAFLRWMFVLVMFGLLVITIFCAVMIVPGG